MTKFGIWSAALLFIFGIVFYYCMSADKEAQQELRKAQLELKKTRLEQRMNARGTLVYAAKDKPAGAVFTRFDGYEKSVKLAQIPQGAIPKLKDGIGHKLLFGITRGQILAAHDFDPPLYDSGFIIVKAAKDITKGKMIELSDLRKCPRSHMEKDNPDGAIRWENVPIGRKLKHSIQKDQIITAKDLE